MRFYTMKKYWISSKQKWYSDPQYLIHSSVGYTTVGTVGIIYSVVFLLLYIYNSRNRARCYSVRQAKIPSDGVSMDKGQTTTAIIVIASIIIIVIKAIAIIIIIVIKVYIIHS